MVENLSKISWNKGMQFPLRDTASQPKNKYGNTQGRINHGAKRAMAQGPPP